MAFWSCTMAPAKRNCTVGDQDMLVIVMLCSHWIHYLEGSWHPVIVLTNHHNLQGFMFTKPLTPRRTRWWETLSSYSLDIQCRTQKTNLADTPSCRPDYRVPSEMPQQGMVHAAPRPHLHALTGNQLPSKQMAHTRIMDRLASVDRCRYHALRQAFATASKEEEPYKNLPLKTLRELIKRSQDEDLTATEAQWAFALP